MGGQPMQMSPEQVEKQKINVKADEMQQKETLAADPSLLSPIDALREKLLPSRPKLARPATMKLFVNNGEVFGNGKSS
jgi:hypothetical protein